MSTQHANPQDGTDIDDLPSDANYIGTDGAGNEQYWSIYRQTAYVISADGEIEAFPLEETPLVTLGQWVSHVERKRGEWEECYVSGASAAELFVQALETGDVDLGGAE